MIPIYRKIRKKMADDNKPMKYMRYAIGEIILVVIGILIALSINNWNEERKWNDLEKDILIEFKQNLLDDVNDMEINLSFHERAISSSQFISHVIENNLPYHDSLDIHFTNVYIIPLFLPTTTAFQNLNKTGTKLIKNDSLRHEIIGLYERKYIYLKNWIDGERGRLLEDFSGLYRSKFSTLDFFGKTHPRNFDKLILDQEYSNYINHQIYFSKYSLSLYLVRKNLAKNIIGMIDLELEK